MTLFRLKSVRREAMLSGLVLILVTGCGERVPGPSPFASGKQSWWKFRGEKIQMQDAVAPYAEGVRSIRGYTNQQRIRGQLHLAIRDQMLNPVVLREYTQKTGIGFKITVYETAEELRKLVRNDSGRVDLALISNRLVEEFLTTDDLERLDHSHLTHLPDLEWPEPVGKFFTRDLPFDPGNNYAVPYLVGSVGIAYNHSVVTEKIHTFGAFLHPKKFSSNMATNVRGRMVLLDDDRYVISAALLSLGEDPNTTNRVALERARQVLMEARPFLYGYGTTNFDGFERVRLAYRMAKGDVVLAQATTGDAALAMRLNHDIEFVVPDEGTILIIDSFVVPKGTANRGRKRLAEQFLNFLLDPVVAGFFVNFSHYATTSQPAKTFVSQEMRKGHTYKFPEREQPRFLLRVVDRDTVDVYHQIYEALTNSVTGSAK